MPKLSDRAVDTVFQIMGISSFTNEKNQKVITGYCLDNLETQEMVWACPSQNSGLFYNLRKLENLNYKDYIVIPITYFAWSKRCGSFNNGMEIKYLGPSLTPDFS